MSAPPPFLLLKVEDFPALAKALGGEAEKLFRALNMQTTWLKSATSGGLTIGDNVKGFEKTLTVTAASFPLKVKNIMDAPPLYVLVGQAMDVTSGSAVPVSLGNPAWTTSGGEIVVSSLGTLDAAKSYRVTFLVLGG